MSCRVFICDDSDGYRLVLRSVLEAEGIEVVGEAGDGRECIDAVADAHPDLVLLDAKMPVMDGFEALPEVLTRVPRAKVVMISTGRASDLGQRSVELGATAFVHKPEHVFEFPELVRRALK